MFNELMNRERFLAVYNVNVEAWADRYGIEAFSVPCVSCGLEVETTIAIAYGDLRGLAASTCNCGSTAEHYCFVKDPRKGSLIMDGLVQTSTEPKTVKKDHQALKHLKLIGS